MASHCHCGRTCARIPCGGCTPALLACRAECRRWSARSYHQQSLNRWDLLPTLQDPTLWEDEPLLLEGSIPNKQGAGVIHTISHEGSDDPQLILSYEDALVGQNTGMMKQLWHVEFTLMGRGIETSNIFSMTLVKTETMDNEMTRRKRNLQMKE